MPAFDWITFCDRYRIDYRDHGPNVGQNHIVVHCPMCGHHDPGMHMSIALDGKGWHCWRDPSHAGINPNRLIQTLLQIDWSSAAAISGTSRGYQQQPPVQTHTLLDRVNVLLSKPPAPTKPPTITLPKTARPLTLNLPVALPYRLYLKGRGIDDLTALDQFGIHFDHRDPRWHGRILFPVTDAARIVAMTARAISNRMEPRYLAEGPVDRHLIWSDRFPPRSRILVLTEGPFDALKINLLGNRYGIWSTCCMTSDFSKHQRALLYGLIPRFERTVTLFDNGNEVNAIRLSHGFNGRVATVQLPSYAKDPAELTNVEWLLDEDHDD